MACKYCTSGKDNMGGIMKCNGTGYEITLWYDFDKHDTRLGVEVSDTFNDEVCAGFFGQYVNYCMVCGEKLEGDAE